MKKMRVALVGAGQIARVSHIPSYQKMEGVEVVGICDTRMESAKRLAEEFHIPGYYDDHKKMFDDCKPDIVSVCVPNCFHCAITIDALNAGCHVLCEKPPAITAEEAVLMAETAKKNGKLLSYGFHLRYSAAVKEIRERIDRGEFGRIYAAEASWLRRRGIPGWGCFTNKAIQGGGPLIDIGAHVLDIAVYLMDYPEIDYVCADMYDGIGKTGTHGLMGEWDPERFTVEDALFGFVHFNDGASLRLNTSFALHMKERDVRNVQIYGEKMGASVFPLELYGGGDGQLWNQQFSFDVQDDLHETEMRRFVSACRGDSPLLVTGEQGSYIQKLLEALYRSAETKKPVLF